jgi:outer membrane receptor protein involved in Fe transport
MLKRTALFSAIVAASSAASFSHAEIEEVLVTATKRSASTQDIAVAVSAITSEKLDQLGVSNFEDYLIQLPGVTAGGSGPGQNTIYIRGVASTTPNLTTAGVAGLAPNVAFYLDEQPLSQPGRNLDVYAADMERIEVLSGPQGTLFGASSQAGTVRLITNKPDPSDTYGRIKVGVSQTVQGESSNNVEAMFNVPVKDNVTVRGVVYRDDQGGYIDNVQGTLTALESARFREAGTMRSNGVPVSDLRAGFQTQTYIDSIQGLSYQENRVPLDPNDPASYALVDFKEANNSDLVEDDFNDAKYEGFRLATLVDLNDDWSLLLGYGHQDLDTDGVFQADPNLGTKSPSVQRYSPESLEDSFDNVNWKLEGRLGDLDIVYAGAYTKRETDQMIDYTDYLFVGQYLPYYICDTTVTYPEYNYYNPGYASNIPAGTCYAPDTYATSYSETTVSTHELRFTTDQDQSVRATGGVFYSDLELQERVDFRYPGMLESNFWNKYDGVDSPLNMPFDDGFLSQEGPFPRDTIFRNDIKRTDEQVGVFGEVTFDLNDEFSFTAGARWYDVRVDMEGGANSSFGNFFQGTDVDAFGTNITDLYDGDGKLTFIGDSKLATRITFEDGVTFDEVKAALTEADGFSVGRGSVANAPNAISDLEITGILNALKAPDEAKTSGTIFKGTLNWTPSADALLYATYSEGFRPGLLNRPGGASNADGYTVPFELMTDEVTNIEFGWKTDLLDGQLRFNGSAFFAEIDNMQTTIFDPSIANLFFSDNAANAEITGLEADFIFAPNSVQGLTLSGGVSFLDTEITEVLTPTDDVVKGDSLAFAPEFQANLQARYEWTLANGLTAHVMPHIAHSGESYSDIIRMNRDEIQGWTMVGLTAGVTGESWGAEFFMDNMTDERAELSRNFVNDRERVSYARPCTMGLRMTYNF